ncbi:MAG TPA: PqiC family protein [Polyangiaceae bacterium]|nr:PqiC family protein [Polyangiaceae bacterium]
MKALVALLCGCLLAGCAHSPEPTYFALSAQRGPSLASGALKVELRRAGLPGYLDRPHIVHRATAERLELEGDERWGASLDEMVGATLAENLAQRLPSCAVYSEAGAISSVPDVRLEVQLVRFERTAQGTVELLAEVAVHQPRADTPTVQRFALSQKPASRRTADVVATMSELLGKLADGIAPLIARGSARAALPPN